MKLSRFRSVFFTIFALVISPVFAEFPSIGLVAHWGFEQSLVDEGGEVALDGTAPNGLSFSEDVPCGTAGVSSGVFDGVNDYVRIDAPVLDEYDADRTISAWFKADDAPSGGTRYVVYESDQFVLSLGLREGSPATNTNVQFFTNTTIVNDPQISVQVPDSLVTGKWIHACVVYRNDGSTRTMSAYLNGVHRQTITIPDPLDLSPNPDFFHIGTYRGANGRWFKGLIDDVGIWDRELTEGEIEGLAFVTPAAETSPPFQVHEAAEIRNDFSVNWTGGWFPSHDDPVVDGQQFPTNPDHGMVTVEASPGTVSFYNIGALDIPGPNLRHEGSGELRMHLPKEVQGFALQVEAIGNVVPDYEISFYTCQGAILGNFTVSPESAAANGVFVGAIDPAARIGMVGVGTSGGEAFAMSYPEFQLGPGDPELFANFPITTQLTMTVNPAVSYLHEGIGGRKVTPATTNASAENVNTCDLMADFPGLRPGDLLLFQRQNYSLKGGSVKRLLAVFSETETIAAGDEFRRVPGAIKAGIDFHTGKVRAEGGSFATGTNIPEDFIVGESSFVGVPDQANFAMLSMEKVTREAAPVEVKISHIRRTPFLDWIAAHGLHGPLAEPGSDFDGDGLTLIEEFVFRRDPLVSDAGADTESSRTFAPRFNNEDGKPLSFVFGARTIAPVRYRSEFSTDLINWVEATGQQLQRISNDASGNTVIRATAAPTTDPSQFGRVGIELIPPNE